MLLLCGIAMVIIGIAGRDIYGKWGCLFSCAAGLVMIYVELEPFMPSLKELFKLALADSRTGDEEDETEPKGTKDTLEDIIWRYTEVYLHPGAADDADTRFESLIEAYWVYCFYLKDKDTAERLLTAARRTNMFYTGSKYPNKWVCDIMQDKACAEIFFGCILDYYDDTWYNKVEQHPDAAG